MGVATGISSILILATGYTMIQAGAVAYGHVLKLHVSRVPGPILIARILKENRGKSSYLFMILWGWWRTKRVNQNDILSYDALRFSGYKARNIRQIGGLYRGLRQEIGHFHAVAVCTQIIRSVDASRNHKK